MMGIENITIMWIMFTRENTANRPCQNRSEQGENLKRGGDGMHSTRTSTALFMNTHSITVYIHF